MLIKQWEDKNLAQFSYAVLSVRDKKIVLIDPSRNPQPYLDYAKENNSTIVGIIETHPHADFISSHVELSNITGAIIYTSSLVDAEYPHTAFDEGHKIDLGEIQLTALHTPGHSPDSISILLEENGRQKAVFTGDTLFIGDCGRPDLREGAGSLRKTRIELAKAMYHTLRDKLIPLNEEVVVYPAHGSGTLCGKDISKANNSTMGHEKQTNWSLQPMTEVEFVESLLTDQPFIPAYFPYDVDVNRKGPGGFRDSIKAVNIGTAIESEADAEKLNKNIIVVDARKEKEYKKTHLPNSVNLMEGPKFETWLGSIIKPGEPFYLAGENEQQLQRLIERAASIGYEGQIRQAFVLIHATQSDPLIDLEAFTSNIIDYTIVDVRNYSEVKTAKPFRNSISIPLPELRNRVSEIPTTKPIVVHCAGGYRSAAGSSLIKSMLDQNAEVLDLGESIKKFL